ncbi:MAG TPA: HAD-IA family hydrolase [Phycisphaerae bacterium]|nr:HAD-IA family hydrolase [Phycisphaerae bacterium]
MSIEIQQRKPIVERTTARTIGAIAVLFDVDGVLADTAGMHLNAWRCAVEEVGLRFSEEVADRLRGAPREASLRIILGDRQVGSARFDAILRRKNELYVSGIRALTFDDCVPGASSFVGALKAGGAKVAAVSASRNARSVLKAIGLLSRFDVVVDGEDEKRHGVHRFLVAARVLGVTGDECIVVEDSVANISIAAGMGMRTIYFGDKSVSAADVIFHQFVGVDALRTVQQVLPTRFR